MNRMRSELSLFVPWTVASVVTIASPALAEMSVEQCVAAHSKGQDFRREGRLGAARSEFGTCAANLCPEVVRNDCTRRLDEVDQAQPSIVFEVVDGSGEDLVDVRVLVDGHLLTDRLDGRALQVDPGMHEFQFEARGFLPTRERFLAREGEAGRRKRVSLRATAPAARPSSPSFPSAQLAKDSASTSTRVPPSSLDGTSGMPHRDRPELQKVLAWSFTGAGVLGLGLGTAFGLKAQSTWSRAEGVCGGDALQCKDLVGATPLRETALREATIGTAGFVAGGLLLATGLVLFLTDRSSAHQGGRKTNFAVVADMQLGRAGLSLSGVIP